MSAQPHFPNTLTVQPDRIPAALQEGRKHVGWIGVRKENGRLDKIPINPDTGAYALTTVPSTWGTCGEALARMQRDNLPGIGRVLTPMDDIAGLDLDHCVDPETGEIAPWAQEILHAFMPTYAEFSPSGTGIRIFVRGRLDDTGCKVGDVEIYDQERFLTMTGHPIPGAVETIAERQDALIALYRPLKQKSPPPVDLDFAANLDAEGAAILQGVRPHEPGTPRRVGLTDRIWKLAHGDDTILKQTDNGPVAYEGESERRYAVICALYDVGLNDDEVRAAFKATPRWPTCIADHGAADAERRLTTQDMPKAKGFITKQREEAAAKAREEQERNGTDGSENVTRIHPDRAAPAREKESTRLLALCAGCEFFHTAEGVPYVQFPRRGHRETWALGAGSSGAFKKWLIATANHENGKVPSDRAISEVQAFGAAMADDREQTRPVFTRRGVVGDKIYLDLGDAAWRAIEIDADGWRIVSDPPIHFRRVNGMLPLPEPVTGGSIHELRTLINVACDDDWVLIVAWLVMTMHPLGPYAHLALHGERGSAKSSATRFLKAVPDPAMAPTRAAPKDEHDIVISARNSCVIAYDNLSTMPKWLSDSLCRVSTGSGLGTRKLYSDDEESLFYGRNPIVFNGIATIAEEGDLIGRCITVNLPTVEGTGARLTEREAEAMFTEMHPRILGALCDAVSTAVRQMPHTAIADPSRMADFEEWVVAASPAFGWERDTFLNAYAANRRVAVGIELDASPVASVLAAFIDEKNWWQGTATELLRELTNKADLATIKLSVWPKQPNKLSGELRRLAPALRTEGYRVLLPGAGELRKMHARLITLSKLKGMTIT